jgi:hypothetical protein
MLMCGIAHQPARRHDPSTSSGGAQRLDRRRVPQHDPFFITMLLMTILLIHLRPCPLAPAQGLRLTATMVVQPGEGRRQTQHKPKPTVLGLRFLDPTYVLNAREVRASPDILKRGESDRRMKLAAMRGEVPPR